ncbi:MAG: head-tail connector protein [Alphaproteobacteria bacterium]|jgi:hypothetical protein|nr:head-tail connector protein [Alphaproteobacteria bacterium]
MSKTIKTKNNSIVGDFYKYGISNNGNNKAKESKVPQNEIANWSINLLEKLSNQRYPLEKLWQQVGNFVLPQKGDNGKNLNDVYDSTAVIAAEYLVAGIWSLISNSSLNWFNIKQKSDENLDTLKDWLIEVNLAMKAMLNNPKQGFYHKSYEFYTDLVCYGTAVFYLSENLEDNSINYQSLSLSNTYLHSVYKDNDTVLRKLSLNATSCIEMFGVEKLSPEILKAYAEDSQELFSFIHLCLPTRYFADKHTQLKGMKYSSFYIDMQTAQVILKSGHYEFPYMIARWYTNSQNSYGQSPAMTVLADIKMINAMSKTMLVSAQKQVDPPILAPSEASVQGIKATPGGVIYGGIDPLTGNQLLRPLTLGGDLSHAYELIDQRRNTIKEAFYTSLLVYAYASNATATEVVATNEQKLRILGSKVSRIQGEFLYPLLIRQLGIMYRLNLLPKLPSKIKFEDIDFEVEFMNSWNRYQKIQESNGLFQLNAMVDKIRNFNPDVVNSLNWDEMLKLVSQANGIPSSILK